jgi:hypothetical protein
MAGGTKATTLRTKFLGCIAGLTVVVILLVVTSLRAIISVDQEPNRVAALDTTQIRRVGTMAVELVALTAAYDHQLLRSLSKDSPERAASERAVSAREAQVETLFRELDSSPDVPEEREAIQSLRSRLLRARMVRSDVDRLVAQ